MSNELLRSQAMYQSSARLGDYVLPEVTREQPKCLFWPVFFDLYQSKSKGTECITYLGCSENNKPNSRLHCAKDKVKIQDNSACNKNADKLSVLYRASDGLSARFPIDL